MRRLALLLVVAVLAPTIAFAVGRLTVTRMDRLGPIRLERGTPVGVLHTAGGAVSAADNYLVAEDQALTSRTAVLRVIDIAWTPGARAAELAQPLPAAAAAGKSATFPGLHLTAAVAANRLESYTGDSAQIGVWHELTVWSPTVEPTQRWMLDTVTLVWTSGQWAVASRSSAPESMTPVPAWTSGTPPDRRPDAFDTRLSGMSTPYYESLP